MGNTTYKDDLSTYGLNIFLLTDYTVNSSLFEKCFGFAIPDDNTFIPSGSCIRYNHPLYKHFSIIQYGNFNEERNDDTTYANVLCKIKENVQISKTENENNLIICFCKNENSALPKEILLQLNTLYTHYQPPIILFTEKPKYLEYMINTSFIPYDKKMVFYCSSDNKETLLNSIIKVFCYYSQYHEIDSLFPILNDNSMMHIFSIYTKDFYNTYMINDNLSKRYAHTINVMVVGRPGVGKSTLINTILGQRRCKESGGRSVTNKLKLVKHSTMNISLYDTPGFEDKSGSEILMNYITKFNSEEYNINYNVHFVLFLINSNTRTLLDGDEEFIKFCMKMKLPMRFVLTRCENEIKANEARNILINDLSKIDHSLIHKINCVQLKDEKENQIVHFGFNELMEEIYTCLSQTRNTHVKHLDSFDKVFAQGNDFAERLVKYLRKDKCDVRIDINEFIVKWMIKAIGAAYGVDVAVNEINMIYYKWYMDTEHTLDEVKRVCNNEFVSKLQAMTFKKYIDKVEAEYNEGIAMFKNLSFDEEFTLLG